MAEMADMERYVVRSLERVALRLRESAFAQPAWRMTIVSEEGSGAITLVGAPAGDFFRGEGIFLGYTQDQLRKMYDSLHAGAPRVG